MNSAMRILILTPSVYPNISGNAVTAERWRRSLADRGISVEVMASDGLDSRLFLERLRNFRPELIHVHHAYKTGGLLLNPGVKPEIASLPLVVSPGGTDVNLDLPMADRKEIVLSVLRMARVVVVQSDETFRSLRQWTPDIAGRIVNIPKASMWFGDEPFDLRGVAACNPEDIVFLLPAGIRPVKRNLECLDAMKRVWEIRPKTRFIAAGPAVDAGYAKAFENGMNAFSAFARWILHIPPAAMRQAYGASDVVLNASSSEGLSNSLLEAVMAGRPVLASDIPANRQVVAGREGDRPAGLLFDPGDPGDFLRKALTLIDDHSLRTTLGAAARLQKARIPSPDDEAVLLIAAYQRALQN